MKKKGKKKLSSQDKEQLQQEKEVREILNNIGFNKIPHINGKHFKYKERISEMDDIFINENVILLVEYTVAAHSSHLKEKKIIYDLINKDPRKFIKFLLEEPKFNKSFKSYFDEKIQGKYSLNQLNLKILYCSKKTVEEGIKVLVKDVVFFDYHIVQYFKSLTKVIKKSSIYEFLDFIEMSFDEFGANIKRSSSSITERFSGHILPEEKSSFTEGYKIVSFYIDAESLIKRSFVLRQSGWRDVEGGGHYQRMFEIKKISSMRRYLTEKRRVFINNIITTISTDKVKLYDKEDNLLEMDEEGQFVNSNSTDVTPALIEINDECNIIGLIDGQHRTYAYHEGDDKHEEKISELRKIQNLLVTGILFPRNEKRGARMKFEANLFLEINSNQKNVKSGLKQEIELMISPFSSVAIGKRVLKKLNANGPLGNLIEQYWYEKGKIKTASVVSYGLKPLIKIEDIKSMDSLFAIWDDKEKQLLKEKDSGEFDVLDRYVEFCVEKIRDIFIALKKNLDKERWETYRPSNPKSVLTVTFINGFLNLLRLLVENNKILDIEGYTEKLKDIDSFEF